METVLLIFLLMVNLVVLTLVYLLFAKSREAREKFNLETSRLEQGEKDVEALQENFKKSLEEIISKDREMIENTSKAIIKYYQDTVNSMTQSYNLNGQKLATVLNQDLRKNLDVLATDIVKQAEETKKVFAAEVQKNLSSTNKRLESYYQERLKEIDAQIYQIVEEAAKNIVAKSINLADHQELVMTSLEQAKRGNFF